MEGIPLTVGMSTLVGRAVRGWGWSLLGFPQKADPFLPAQPEAGLGEACHHPLPLQHLPVSFNCSTSFADTALPLPGGSASPRLTVKPREAEPTLMSPGSKM